MDHSRETLFETTEPHTIPSGELTPLPLSCTGERPPSLEERDGGVGFTVDGWYEVLLEVDWDPSALEGTRFCHTKIPGQQPLHSEAVSAGVLGAVSGGRQLLRGNARFAPGGASQTLLEVWHDAGRAIRIERGALVVRELRVPWALGGDRIAAAARG